MRERVEQIPRVGERLVPQGRLSASARVASAAEKSTRAAACATITERAPPLGGGGKLEKEGGNQRGRLLRAPTLSEQPRVGLGARLAEAWRHAAHDGRVERYRLGRFYTRFCRGVCENIFDSRIGSQIDEPHE